LGSAVGSNQIESKGISMRRKKVELRNTGQVKTGLWIAGFAMAVVLPACVTINIYFPAAAAEKAADKIIDEVWQLKQEQQGTPSPADAPAATTTP
jgi:hypothetical protein